jgi:hypothetical protein
MPRWLRKIHIYIGLFSTTALFMFGATGLSATWDHTPLSSAVLDTAIRQQPITISAEIKKGDDLALAKQIYAQLDLAFTRPAHPRWIRRNPQGQLTLRFYTPNGHHDVTLLAREQRVEIVTHRISFWQFLSRLHGNTFIFPSSDTDWRLVLWSVYGEFGLFSLLFLTGTGGWMWVSSRQRARRQPHREGLQERPWIRIHRVIALSILPLLAIYAVSGLEMAHTIPFTENLLFKGLAALHHKAGLFSGGVLVNLWGVAVIAVSLGLMGLGLTGLPMWLGIRNDRRLGAVILTLGLAYSLVSILLIRTA